ncbi:jg24400, partial [Pararge aegeria aegeria]
SNSELEYTFELLTVPCAERRIQLSPPLHFPRVLYEATIRGCDGDRTASTSMLFIIYCDQQSACPAWCRCCPALQVLPLGKDFSPIEDG